jgi:hypothetical protein
VAVEAPSAWRVYFFKDMGETLSPLGLTAVTLFSQCNWEKQRPERSKSASKSHHQQWQNKDETQVSPAQNP